MKSIQGLIVAAGLGVAGAVLNYFYLAGETQKIAMVSFIGIKPGAVIGRGDRLTTENLTEVRIPKNAVGNLTSVAFLWDELPTVENAATWRTLSDSALLLRSDLKTPPPELELGKEETAMWIPVDARAFVPSLLMPGDLVSFKVPALHGAAGPPPAAGGLRPVAEEQEGGPPAPTGPTETIGPFKVLSIGNRLGSPQVMQAAKIPPLQENVLTIRVSKLVAGEADRAEKLWNRLQAVNFRQVGIVLHAKP
jgi:hypothetical protein